MEAGEDVVDVLLSSDGSWEKIKDHSHPVKDALGNFAPNQNISFHPNLTVDSYTDVLMTDAGATTSRDNMPADNRK